MGKSNEWRSQTDPPLCVFIVAVAVAAVVAAAVVAGLAFHAATVTVQKNSVSDKNQLSPFFSIFFSLNQRVL